MITLSLCPYIITSMPTKNWKDVGNKIVYVIACVAIDCIYIIPMCM